MLRKSMKITDAAPFVKDGQQRHGHQHATIDVGMDALYLLKGHLPECPNKQEIKPDTDIPLQFVMSKGMTGEATLICGWCKQEIGICTVLHVKDKK